MNNPRPRGAVIRDAWLAAVVYRATNTMPITSPAASRMGAYLT